MPTQTPLKIGWGRTPRSIRVPVGTTVVESPKVCAPELNQKRILAALDAPVGSSSLDNLLASSHQICVLWPDESRRELFSIFWDILTEKLSSHSVSHGIAAGKHAFHDSAEGMWRHDARSEELIHCGYTHSGTPVSYPKILLTSDLIISVGEIRPHYFAGYSGGAKTVFPGAAGEEGIWKNHRMKALSGSRLGQVDGNPCRADMEEAARFAGRNFIINIVRDHDNRPVEVVCGDPITAHRAGVELARPYFEQSVDRRFDTVLVSDGYPISMSLYQACKMLPVAGRILNPGGTVIMCADCLEGVEPIQVVNEAIYRLGCIPSLPRDHTIQLASCLPQHVVRDSFAHFIADLDALLDKAEGKRLAVLPYAANVIPFISTGVQP